MAKQLIKVSALEVNRYGFFLAIDGQYMMLIFLADIFGLISFSPLHLKKESRAFVYCRVQYGSSSSSSSLIHSNNTYLKT